MSNIILAVAGLAGSGKSEAAAYILKKTGWPSVHFGDTVVNETKARGLEVNQTNERVVRDEFRKIHGMAAMAIVNLPRIRTHFAEGSVVIESFYSWEEYTTLVEEFGGKFFVLAIYANFNLRAARLAHRPTRSLTSDELNARDYSQIETLHQAGPIARADFMVINEGSQAELHDKLDAVLAKLSQI